MKYNIKVQHLNNKNLSSESVEFASSCPCCGVTLRPTCLYAVCVDSEEEEDNLIYLLNHCEKCNECFISKHPYDTDTDYSYCFDSSAPVKIVECTFSPAICNLSHNFVDTYKQALQAEQLGLTNICGMGYRRAIEFLIKDYILHKDPSLENKVVKLPLGQCIKEYISDERLTTLARASTWLGNDETHYVRLHPNYALEDLRIFINAFVTFIDADLAYEAADQLLSQK